MAKDRETEIRLALFGQSAAGKTTLLASFYGNQQRHAFVEKHGYRLQAEDAADGDELLGRYYGMQQGEFPRGSDQFSEHRFALKVRAREQDLRAFRVVWYDYPGGWWEHSPKDESEQRARHEALARLATSHVGIFLIDGAKYRDAGIAYVRRLLDQFKNEVGSITVDRAASGDTLPKQWILAVSKADLLEGMSAEAVHRDLVMNASDQLKGLAAALHARDLGRHVLLLSAAEGDGAHVMAADKYVGLSLIVPLAFSAILSALASAAGSGDRIGLLRKVLEKLGLAFDIMDKLDDVLPRKYQILTHLLRMLDVKTAIERGDEWLREQQQKAAQRGHALEAAALAMTRELKSDAARDVYYQSPG